ncbi:hypothetical protein CPT_Seabear_015 [Salmonella phage Seabear]|nr:hypothetical protein CPT_Seabear_015 [Salmonella phage Seabear]
MFLTSLSKYKLFSLCDSFVFNSVNNNHSHSAF